MGMKIADHLRALSIPRNGCSGEPYPPLCHPERTPDFLLRCANQRPRMRLSVRKAAWGLSTPQTLTGNPEVAEGPAVRLSRPKTFRGNVFRPSDPLQASAAAKTASAMAAASRAGRTSWTLTTCAPARMVAVTAAMDAFPRLSTGTLLPS